MVIAARQVALAVLLSGAVLGWLAAWVAIAWFLVDHPRRPLAQGPPGGAGWCLWAAPRSPPGYPPWAQVGVVGQSSRFWALPLAQMLFWVQNETGLVFGAGCHGLNQCPPSAQSPP